MNPSEQSAEFVPAPDGGIDHGYFTGAKGDWVGDFHIPDGPFRLPKGTDRYGKTHITHRNVGRKTNKIARLQKHGYQSLEEASQDIAQNHTHVYVQDASPHYLFVKKEAAKTVLHVVENRIHNDGYYSIISTYDVKVNYFDNNKGRRLIWERGRRSIPSDSSGFPYCNQATKQSEQLGAGATGQIEPHE